LYISRTRDYTTSSQSLITSSIGGNGNEIFGFPPFLLLVGVAIKKQQTKIEQHKMESAKIFSAAQHVPELRGPAFDEIAPHDVRNNHIS